MRNENQIILAWVNSGGYLLLIIGVERRELVECIPSQNATKIFICLPVLRYFDKSVLQCLQSLV
jgi:hypothetical protein